MDFVLGLEDVSMIQLIRRFRKDSEIRRLPFDFEDALKDHFGSTPQLAPDTSNIPDNAPRFVFADKRKQLVATGIALQLSLTFHDGFPVQSGLHAILSKYSGVMDEVCDSLLKHQEEHYSGVIVVFNKKTPNNFTSASNIANALFKMPGAAKPAAANFSYGIEKDNLLYTLTAAGVARYSARVEAGKSFVVDGDFDEPDDHCLEFKVDVNTKLQARNNLKKAFSNLVPSVMDVLEGKVESLNNPLLPRL